MSSHQLAQNVSNGVSNPAANWVRWHRSHGLRGNVNGDALRHSPLERCFLHSHA